MDFTLEEYEANLETLRKNHEKVPLEVLKTRYAKPYNELIQKIKKQSEEILVHFLFDYPVAANYKDDPEEGAAVQEFIDRGNEIIEEKKKSGAMKRISQAIFREHSMEKMLDIAAEEIWPEVFYGAYGPYWLRHCVQDGDKIRNDLIGMTWKAEWNIWQRDDGMSFTAMLPPTEELIRKEMEEHGNQKGDRPEQQRSA